MGVLVSSIEGRIVVSGGRLGMDPVLAPAEARRLAAALVEAADHIDPAGSAPAADAIAEAVRARIARGDPADLASARRLAHLIELMLEDRSRMVDFPATDPAEEIPS